MRNGIQSFYLSLGEEACFFLQLLNIAESEVGFDIDPITAAIVCKNKDFIYFNTDNLRDKNNFLIKKHPEILELLTGQKWQYAKESPSYKQKKGEYIINEYQNGTFTHFDGDNFHSLQSSQTVKNGKIVSKRVFKVLK